MKLAHVLFHRATLIRGWVRGQDFNYMLHVHDEAQIECLPTIAEEAGEMYVGAIQAAGKLLGMRIALDGEAKVGANWKETH
jgi:DNA polymerase I-like protein with 3'-5' exonuclease and polymerase domains